MPSNMESEDSLPTIVENCILSLTENDCENQSSVYRSKLLMVTENIKSKNSNLLQVVELLATPLTDTIIPKRCAGTCFLTDVLETLSSDILQEKEMTYFVEFYCDRLKDHYLVMPHAINGLHVLSSYQTLPPGSATQILRILFKEINNQSQLQHVRYSVYRICSNFLQSRLNEIQEMEQEFVFGYIQIMDGEKDPQNLLLCFNIVYFIAKNLHLDPFIEELFEVVACYFPIDFTPPPDSPHNITREALIKGLRKCLSATSLFAPYCIPLLIEKLDSDITEAKIDALKTLIMCCDVYNAEHFSPFCHSMWSSIRREMFLSVSESVQEMTLQAVTVLVKVFSSSIITINSHSCLEDFLDEIIKECKKYLCEPELKLIHPSAKILLAAASASNSACYIVLTNIIPLLLDQFNQHSQNNCQDTILEILNEFLDAFLQTMSNVSDDVNYNYNDLLVTYFSVLNDTNENLYPASLKGFYKLLMKNDLLSASHCEKLCDFLSKFILNYSQNSIQQISVKLLEKLSEIHPQIVHDHVFPCLTNVITEEQLLHETVIGQVKMVNEDDVKYYNALIALSAVCPNELLTSNVLNLLLTHIKKLANSSCTSSLKKIIGCIECVYKITQFHKKDKNEFLLSNIFFPFLDLTIAGAMSSSSVLQEREVILSIAKVLGEITSTQSENCAENLIKEINFIFVHGKSNSIVISGNNFFPLHLHSPPTQVQLIFILESVVCFTTKSNCISDEVITYLQTLALKHTDQAISEAAVRIIATILNKLPDDSYLSQLILKFETDLLELIHNAVESLQKRALFLWIWITKALVIRSHSKMEDFLKIVLQSLNTNGIQNMGTEAFLIVSEDYIGMSASSHSNINILYRQKLFVKTIPHLISGFNEAFTKDQQLYYLTAVTYLLHSLPFHVLSGELDSLLPLLIQALDFENTNLLNTALNTLNSMLCENPNLVSKYLMSLYSHFIRLAQQGSTMKIRMNALDCLNSMIIQEQSLILPIKNDVIRGLALCLDDKKRLVRQKAVVTRGNWFLIGAPGGK